MDTRGCRKYWLVPSIKVSVESMDTPIIQGSTKYWLVGPRGWMIGVSMDSMDTLTEGTNQYFLHP